MIELLNKVRTGHEVRIYCVAVDQRRIGRQFMQEHGVDSLARVLFDPAGRRHTTLTRAINEQRLSIQLNKIAPTE